jgi:hypothetical protein
MGGVDTLGTVTIGVDTGGVLIDGIDRTGPGGSAAVARASAGPPTAMAIAATASATVVRRRVADPFTRLPA